MNFLKRFILMLRFMTTIPLGYDPEASPEDNGKALVFAPVVGLVLGGILAGSWFLLSGLLPLPAAAVLAVIEYILLTGGLHLDGLGDTFDGLFSGRTRERMLEIMRDSRVGMNAVLAVASVILLDTALLYSLDSALTAPVLLLFPVAGRVGSLVSAGVSRYARSGEGLGKSFIDFCRPVDILKGLIPYFAIFYLVWGFKGLAVGLIPPVTALLLIKTFARKIGGATGDILGAVCEINQTIFLLCVLVLSRFA